MATLSFDKKTALLLGKKMPREQRDVLFLLGVLTFILIPHFFYLPPWITLVTLSTLLWRAWMSKDPAKKLPGKLVRFTLLCVFVGLTLISYKSILGPEAGGCLLVVLIALKTLELRARRDALVIFYLGFFLIMIGFFHSQNIATAFILFIGLTGLLAALINAHMVAGYPPLKDAFKVAIRLILYGTPFMVVLFMVFPRLDPLWGLPDSAVAKTGVSDTLSIGSISQLVQNTAVAFRVQFEGDPPEQQNMYYRGPVLEYFDGRTWHVRGAATQSHFSENERSFYHDGNPISYEVTLESTNQPWLFTLDLTTHVTDSSRHNVFMVSNYQWLSRNIISARTRYKATAYTDYHAGVEASPQSLAGNTFLPQTGNPRTRQWAQELMERPEFAALNAREKANWFLEYINSEEFFYTLAPPAGYTPESAADQLWFDYKAGFCEHYAFSFVILMRSLGIPARIVTGYQGGELNYIDHFWVVRQSNAHAWAEIWQEGEGWIRVDPTSAIAPHRILEDTRLQDNNAADGFASLGFVTKLLMRWDALENAWNQWVLAYNTNTGIDLLERLGFKSPNWMTLLKVFAGLFAVVMVIIFFAYKWRKRQKDSWLKVYNQLCQKLQHSGYNADMAMAPRTVLHSLESRAEQSSIDKQVCEILLELEKLRYSPSSYTDHELKQGLKHLAHTIGQLKLK